MTTGENKSNFHSLAAEAGRRGIAVSQLGARGILALSGFDRTAWLFGTITDRTSHLAVRLADDKRATKQLLSIHALPTPAYYAVDLEDEAVNAFVALDSHVVVKPHDGYKGRGVSVALTSEDQVRRAFRLASHFSRIVLVERYHAGRDYRILVVNGQVVAVVERELPVVMGDGILSIAELITEQNKDPRRGEGEEKPMTKIKMDARMDEFLSRSGQTLQTVPERGQTVVLNAMGSMSLGSVSIDRTDEIHPETAAMVVKATQVIGLDIAGVDLIARDISLPLITADAKIIEINCSPGLRAHLCPVSGMARNPAVNIIDYLFPESLV